jgi:hypothetical protein
VSLLLPEVSAGVVYVLVLDVVLTVFFTISVPFLYQMYEYGAVPSTVTLKVAVPPSFAVWFEGWDVTELAVQTG